MNTRVPIESANPTVVLSVSFNNDSSCFAVGLDNGFKSFDSATCQVESSRDFNGGVGLVQMMGKSNILAVVGGGRQPKFPQNKVIVWNDLKNKVGLELTAFTAVRGVQLNQERVVMVLQNSVRVYALKKPPTLLSAYETADNLLGLCAMSAKTIAFPSTTVGQIKLVDLATGNVSIIPAHQSAVRALQFSPDGELLASASDKGTLIRVFSTNNCARVAELRRGIDPATIFSLGFSPSGTMLACTSDKGTLHIFDVPHPNKPARKPASPKSPQFPSGAGGPDNGEDKGKWGILGKIPLMPRMFSDVYSFASVPFEAGDEPLVGGLPMSENPTLGTSRPPKGVIGWISEDSLLVVGAGRDARWEKFVISEGEDGRRFVARAGWKRYLGNN